MSIVSTVDRHGVEPHAASAVRQERTHDRTRFLRPLDTTAPQEAIREPQDDPIARARTSAVLEAPGTTPAGTQATILVKGDVPTGGVLRRKIPGVEKGNWLEARADALRLRSWDSTVREQLLNRGGIAVLGLCIGLGAVLLRRLLLSTADGPIFAESQLSIVPLVTALLLLVLAEAFRRGTELAREVDGLV